jgi:hypothetical protein
MYQPSIFRRPRRHHEKQSFEFGTSRLQFRSITVSPNLFKRRSSSSCPFTDGVSTYSAKRWDRYVIRPRRCLPHSSPFIIQSTLFSHASNKVPLFSLATEGYYSKCGTSLLQQPPWFIFRQGYPSSPECPQWLWALLTYLLHGAESFLRS